MTWNHCAGHYADFVPATPAKRQRKGAKQRADIDLKQLFDYSSRHTNLTCMDDMPCDSADSTEFLSFCKDRAKRLASLCQAMGITVSSIKKRKCDSSEMVTRFVDLRGLSQGFNIVFHQLGLTKPNVERLQQNIRDIEDGGTGFNKACNTKRYKFLALKLLRNNQYQQLATMLSREGDVMTTLQEADFMQTQAQVQEFMDILFEQCVQALFMSIRVKLVTWSYVPIKNLQAFITCFSRRCGHHQQQHHHVPLISEEMQDQICTVASITNANTQFAIPSTVFQALEVVRTAGRIKKLHWCFTNQPAGMCVLALADASAQNKQKAAGILV